MKRTLATAAILSLAVIAPVRAADKADPKPACHTIAEMKASVADAKFTTLNAGQFHLLVGAYMVLPPPSLPPKADGAVLVQTKHTSLVVWTKGLKPVCLAEVAPMPIADKFVAILKSINPGQGETIDADSGDGDVHL